MFTLDFTTHYFSRNSTHAAALVTHIQLRVTKPVETRPPHCTGSLIGSRRSSPRVLRAFSTSLSLPAFYFIPQCTRARLDSESHILRPKVLIPVRYYPICLPHYMRASLYVTYLLNINVTFSTLNSVHIWNQPSLIS